VVPKTGSAGCREERFLRELPLQGLVGHAGVPFELNEEKYVAPAVLDDNVRDNRLDLVEFPRDLDSLSGSKGLGRHAVILRKRSSKRRVVVRPRRGARGTRDVGSERTIS